MADYPQRTVTNQSIWDEYESAVRVEALRKKYGNMLFNARSALSPAFRGSAQSRSWKSAINKGGSSLTGLSGRLKMMRDADKEMVAKQFTTKFQDGRRKNPDGTLEQFNKEADEWGPWYSVDLRSKHASEVQRSAKESSRLAKEARDIKTYEDAQL